LFLYSGSAQSNTSLTSYHNWLERESMDSTMSSAEEAPRSYFLHPGEGKENRH
jgi:hypothetical protein